MVRPPSFDRNGMKKGAWSDEEDNLLRAHVERFGHPNWRHLPFLAGLARCGKSCRLRWVNYLKPGVRKGNFSKEEEDLIIKLHGLHGNKWTAIAKKLPGRTDNDIKNYWHAHIKKRGKRGLAVTRVTSANQLGQEEQSSELSSCVIADHHQEEISFGNVFALGLCAEDPENNNVVTATGDAYLGEQLERNLLSELYYDQNQVSMDLPPFPWEEFSEFGSCMNDMSTFSDSSKAGMTDSRNSTSAEFQDIFWSGQFGGATLWYFDDNMNVF